MADVKNYGLKGIGSDVQLGKAGGRLVYNATGGGGGLPTIEIVNANNSAAISIKGRGAVDSDEYVTLSQLDSVSAGITVKASCRVTTTAAISIDGNGDPAGSATWNASGGTGGTGEFTGAPLVVDGETLVAGDRVLVRLEGVTLDGNGNLDSIDNGGATRNGIFEVTTAGTGADGVWERAQDHNTDETVRFGDYTFVSEGTQEEGRSFILSNFLGTSPSPNEPTLNVDPVTFVLFSSAPTYEAAVAGGIELVGGDEFQLDIDNLASASSALTSTIAFGDGSVGGQDEKQTLGGIFDTHNVVYGLQDFASTGTGFVARTAEDVYRTIDFSEDPAAEGISITEDLAGSGTVQWGLDIAGITDDRAGSSAVTDELALATGVAGGNSRVSLGDMMNDLDVVRSNGLGNGILVKSADDVYVNRSIDVNSAALAGLNVVNGDGVAGNPTLGIDIASLTGIAAKLSDTLLVLDANDASNKSITVQGIIDLVSGAISDNEISQGDSSVVVTDDDISPGRVDITVDGNISLAITDGLVDADALIVQDLVDGRVTFAGAGGRLTDDPDLTFNGSDLTVGGAVNAGSVASVGNVSGAQGQFNSLSITGSGTFGSDVSMAQLTATGGNFSGGAVSMGALTATSGGFSGAVSADSLSATGNGITDSSLTPNGAVVFTDGSSRLVDDGASFSYDTNSDTLSLVNLSVSGTFTGGGLNNIGEDEVAFGVTGGGAIESSANLTFASDILSVSTLGFDGANQVIQGNAIDGDISIVPNGTGEVVIGSAGAGVIGSDAGQTMTVDGDAGLILSANTGNVMIMDGGNNVAQFDSAAGADTHFTFTSDLSTNGMAIGTSQDSDIKFVLGTNNLVKVGDNAAYDAALAGNSGDALVTKSYVDDQIATGASNEAIKSLLTNVDLSADGSVSVGSVPAGSTMLRAKVQVNTLDSAATLSVGDGTDNNRYMSDAENDPAITGIYMSEVFDTDGTSIAISAVVASSAGDVGANADVIVEYRLPVAP